MQGIKAVAEHLKGFAMRPLPSVIEPNGDECRKCKSLLYDTERNAEKRYIKIKSLDQNHIKVIEGCDLTQQAPPCPFVEEIENQNGENACTVVVQHENRTGYVSQKTGTKACEDLHPKKAGLSGCFVEIDKSKTAQQRPNNILMEGVENAAAVHQIKWDFRNQRKEEQAQGIATEIMGVEVSLHYQKCKDRKCKSANAVEPLRTGNEHCPKVIAEHECHSQQVERHSAQVKMIRAFHNMSSQNKDLVKIVKSYPVCKTYWGRK